MAQDRSLRKRTDRLQLHAELMSELPLYVFPNTCIFSSLEIFACKENNLGS